MKVLVLMVKPNPKAPLPAWAARLYPVSRAVFIGHCAPGVPPRSPLALYPSMHRPPAQRAGTGAKLPSDCPWGGGVATFLETGSRPPKKHEGMLTIATAYGHQLGALQTPPAIFTSTWHSTDYSPLFVDEDPEDQKVYLPTNNKAGLRIHPDSTETLSPFVTPTA